MASKILLVDDEPDILKMLRIRLQKAGYEVSCNDLGSEAVDMALKISPDAIILDIIMPEMNGFEVKAKLNEDPLTASIPVIFLSADTATSAKLKGLGLGADDYVTKPFDPEELLARIKSILGKKRYYEKLSMTDGLTGLYNHAFFKQQLSLFFNMAKRYKKTFSLILIDIDALKKINDKYGHIAGDMVLKEFSSIARQVLRTSDILARYGGDEFAMLLPETDLDRAKIAMKRLKEKIEAGSVSVPGSDKKIAFSISAGAAFYDSDCMSETELFSHADERLYEDKAKK